MCSNRFFFLLFLLCCTPVFQCRDKELESLFGLSKKSKRNELYMRTGAPQQHFQFYVSFRLSKVDMHFCSGTLISPKWILTSASCMDREFSGPFVENATVHIGVFNLEPDPPKPSKSKSKKINDGPCEPDLHMKIKNVEVPKKYSNGSEGRPPYDARYDIALVELKEPSLQPWALLPVEEPDCCEDADFVNVGLGRSETAGPFAETLEMAAFAHMPFNECAEAFEESTDETLGKGTKNISSEMTICVDGKKKYCQLDRGSGLLQYRGQDKPPLLVGFANEATKECSYGRPYAFSNVAFHMNWIRSVKGVFENMAGYEQNASSCRSNIKITPRLLGAVEAVRGRYPYAVSVRRHTHLCQGVLISPSHVLTTGSCIPPEDFGGRVSSIEAYIGGLQIEPESDADGKGEHETIKAKDVIYHHRLDHPRRHVDLAIIVLEKPSKLTPIKLPFKSTSLIGNSCIVYLCKNEYEIKEWLRHSHAWFVLKG